MISKDELTSIVGTENVSNADGFCSSTPATAAWFLRECLNALCGLRVRNRLVMF